MNDEYKALVSGYEWPTRDERGVASSDIDPFYVLRAAKVPQNVLAAFELARDSGYAVVFKSHASNIGGGEYVAAVDVTNPTVREAFDALDRAKVADNGPMMCPRRWFDGEWHWLTEFG